MTPAADDISERYLAKAIAEMNDLGHEIAEAAGADRVAVLGSGHPLADIFLLKHRPADRGAPRGRRVLRAYRARRS